MLKFVLNFIKKRLQRRCLPVKFKKFLITPILKNIWERLLLTNLNRDPDDENEHFKQPLIAIE